MKSLLAILIFVSFVVSAQGQREVLVVKPESRHAIVVKPETLTPERRMESVMLRT